MKKSIILSVLVLLAMSFGYADIDPGDPDPIPDPLSSDICICDASTDCCLQGNCYPAGPAPTLIGGDGDVDGDGDRDYCDNGIWKDCGSGCGGCCGAGEFCGGNNDCVSGECVGELDGSSCTGGFCVDDECCTDNMVECDQYGTAWSCDSNAGCCDNDYDCVKDGTCYDGARISGKYAVYSLNPGGDDDISACDMGIWYDCDEDPTKCGVDPYLNCGVVVGESYGVYAGETGVGEYGDMTTEECCGDDYPEFLKCNSVTSECRCCDSMYDVLDEDDKCLDCSSTAGLSCKECLTCSNSGTYPYFWCTDIPGDDDRCVSDYNTCLTYLGGTPASECVGECDTEGDTCNPGECPGGLCGTPEDAMQATCCDGLYCSDPDEDGSGNCCPAGEYWGWTPMGYTCMESSGCGPVCTTPWDPGCYESQECSQDEFCCSVTFGTETSQCYSSSNPIYGIIPY